MIKSEKSFFRLIKSSRGEYEKIVNSLSKYYFRKLIPKTDQFGFPILDENKKVKFRVLYPPKGRLRRIQELINFRILNKITLPKALHGSIRKKSGITNAKVHQGNKFFFQTDLKSYFPSINNEIIFAELRKLGFSDSVANIMTNLLSYNYQLPQGAPSSPTLSNLVFLPQDKSLIELSKSNNLTYTRYIDDLTFSSSHFINDTIIQSLLDQVRNSPFSYHHRKTKLSIGKAIITGAEVGLHELKPTDIQLMKYALYESNSANARGLKAYFEQLENS